MSEIVVGGKRRSHEANQAESDKQATHDGTLLRDILDLLNHNSLTLTMRLSPAAWRLRARRPWTPAGRRPAPGQYFGLGTSG